MTTLFSVPSNSYNAATRRLGPTPKLLPSYTKLKLTFTRESWPVADPLVTFAFEISLDNTNWVQMASLTAQGGVIQSPLGGPLLNQSLYVEPLWYAGNPNRQIRVFVTNALALQTAITVEAE